MSDPSIADPAYETVALELRVEVDRLIGDLAPYDKESVARFGRTAQEHLARAVAESAESMAIQQRSSHLGISDASHKIADQARSVRRWAALRRWLPFGSDANALLDRVERANAQIEQLCVALEYDRAASIDECVHLKRLAGIVEQCLQSVELHMAALIAGAGQSPPASIQRRLDGLRASRILGRQAAITAHAAIDAKRDFEDRVSVILEQIVPIWRKGMAKILSARVANRSRPDKRTIRQIERSASEVVKALPDLRRTRFSTIG